MMINKKSQVRIAGLIMLLFLIILTVFAVEYEQEETLKDTYTTNTNTLSIPLPKDLEGYKGYSLNVIGKGDGVLKNGVLEFSGIEDKIDVALTLFYKNEEIIKEFEVVRGIDVDNPKQDKNWDGLSDESSSIQLSEDNSILINNKINRGVFGEDLIGVVMMSEENEYNPLVLFVNSEFEDLIFHNMNSSFTSEISSEGLIVMRVEDNFIDFVINNFSKERVSFSSFVNLFFTESGEDKFITHFESKSFQNSSVELYTLPVSFIDFFNSSICSGLGGSSSTGCQSICSQNSQSSSVTSRVCMYLLNISCFRSLTTAFDKNSISNDLDLSSCILKDNNEDYLSFLVANSISEQRYWANVNDENSNSINIIDNLQNTDDNSHNALDDSVQASEDNLILDNNKNISNLKQDRLSSSSDESNLFQSGEKQDENSKDNSILDNDTEGGGVVGNESEELLDEELESPVQDVEEPLIQEKLNNLALYLGGERYGWLVNYSIEIFIKLNLSIKGDLSL